MARLLTNNHTGPSTVFGLDADWGTQDAANNRTLVKVWRQCWNGPAGNSTSHSNNLGRHSWWSNDIGEGVGNTIRQQAPFLPSGYAQNQLRWSDYYEYWVTHDGNGNRQLQFAQRVNFGVSGSALGTNEDQYTGVYNIPRIPQVPGTMAPPTFSGITANAVTINWVAPSRGHADINNYDLHVCTAATHDPSVCTVWYNWTGSTATSKSFTTLARNTKYYVAMRANNSDGPGGWSTWASFTTNAFSVPSKPTGYSVSDKTSTSFYTTMPAVADNGGGPLDDLRIEYSTAPNSTGSTVVALGSYTTAFVNNLTAGTYYLRMAVHNAVPGGGWSDWGDWITITMATNVPTQVNSIVLSGVTDTQVTVTWAVPSSLNGSTLTGYFVRVAQDRTFATGLKTATVDASTLTATITGLTAGTTYFVQVWPTSNNGPGGYSNILSFITDATATDGIYMNIGGTVKFCEVYINDAGTIKRCSPYQNVGGVIKLGVQ
jgi:hypothetical protein